MATSTIPRRTASPTFEDSSYGYVKRPGSIESNSFPSTPTYNTYKYTFNIAKTGYRAVGVVSYSLRNDYVPDNYMNETFVSFDYTNQTVTLLDRPAGSFSPSSETISFTATIKYMKL